MTHTCRHCLPHLLCIISYFVGCSGGPNFQDAAVDSSNVPFDRGSLDLNTEQLNPDLSATATDRCSGSQSIAFDTPQVVINGSTEKAENEFGASIHCGEPQSFSGPQRYYRATLSADKSYRLTLQSTFNAGLYLFSGCSTNIINADCSALNSDGRRLLKVSANTQNSIVISPNASGTFYFAVDSQSPNDRGTFTLSFDVFDAPENAYCEKAQPLVFTDGTLNTNGSTLGSRNEFGQAIECGIGQSLDGPQVYYTVALTHSTWYQIDLVADFAAILYVANRASQCKAGNIEQDCSSLIGTVLNASPAGVARSTAFMPLTSGTYVIAIDTADPHAAGTFSLSMKTITPASSTTCSNAQPAFATDGQFQLTSTTKGLLNDLGAHIYCGFGPRLIGPQRYYALPLVAQVSYDIALTADFAAHLALASTCSAMVAECSSSGLAGLSFSIAANTTQFAQFTPTKTGTYVLAVDSSALDDSGQFTVTVIPSESKTHGKCAAPRSLTFTDQTATATGNTGFFSNDIAGVNCGLPAGPWDGPQAYYSVAIPAGKSATVTLSPENTFDAALYAFASTTGCQPSGINPACTGRASDTLGGGKVESFQIKATPTAQTYVLVVDSWSPSEVGNYKLQVVLN